ncbi:MAG: hypothetical protein JRJ59_00025 [Deltaproteobacteria bacterium]|nr:hypothetical protein [Deltaproteobacteria bacterium]
MTRLLVISRLGVVICLGLVLAGLFPGAVTALGRDWPWAAGPQEILGTIALVLVPAGRRPPWPALMADRVKLYACGQPGCTDGPPLILPLTRAKEEPAGGYARRFLVLDLPPGSYRLAEVQGRVRGLAGEPEFRLPLHYIFQVREGRTVYLGRLILSWLDTEDRLVKIRGQRGRTAMGRCQEPGQEALAVLCNVEDHLVADAGALVRAFPGRHFYQFGVELMVWMK